MRTLLTAAVAVLVTAGCVASTPMSTPSAPPETGDGPIPVSASPPQYPSDALMRGETGWVRLSFTIEPDGSVSDVEVADSEPGRVFDAAARRALGRWTFDPADAGPAEYTIRFELGAP